MRRVFPIGRGVERGGGNSNGKNYRRAAEGAEKGKRFDTEGREKNRRTQRKCQECARFNLSAMSPV